jgi:hypothetical protein
MNFFGTAKPKVSPLDEAKTWKRNVEREARKLDRDILALQRVEKKAMADCKKYAKQVFLYYY